MSTFNYHIDTQPLAEEMGNVSKNVNLTTGAVVAMQAAVIAAEERASDHVCDNVNRGFYSLIRSQISQKLAKYKSDYESKRMLLSHQKRALVSIKSIMERDYNMISKRYTKLFNGLNSNLQTRIFEVDKPMIDFSYRDIGRMTNRSKYLTAVIPVTQLESVASSQMIVASNIKKRGLSAINSIKAFILDMHNQESLTNRILVDERITRNSEAYLPVALCEFENDPTGSRVTEFFAPGESLGQAAITSISNTLHTEFHNTLATQDIHNRQEVRNEFLKLMADSKKPARVKDVVIDLFNSGQPQREKS